MQKLPVLKNKKTEVYFKFIISGSERKSVLNHSHDITILVWGGFV